jgi:hypothetical protein
VLRVVGEFLRHERPSVRHSAVLSTAYFEWPATLPLLDDLIGRETDAEVLADAKLGRSRLAWPPDLYPITGFERLVVEGRETIWAQRWVDGRHVIASIPQIVRGLSFDDCVDVERRGDVTVMTRLRAKSGHRTLHLAAIAPGVEELCRRHRARLEMRDPARGAVDVPPELDLATLTRELDRLGVAWEQADPSESR